MKILILLLRHCRFLMRVGFFFLRGRRKLRKFFFLIVTKLSEIKIFQFFVKRFLIFNVGIDDFKSITIDYDDDNDDKWNSKKKKDLITSRWTGTGSKSFLKKKKIFGEEVKKFSHACPRFLKCQRSHFIVFFFLIGVTGIPKILFSKDLTNRRYFWNE